MNGKWGHLVFWPVCLWLGDAVLLACGARGPGFDFRSCLYDFRFEADFRFGYVLLPSRDICEIPLKWCKSSIQPANNSVMLSVNFNLCHNFSVVKDRDFIFCMHENNSFGLCCCKGHSCFTNTPCSPSIYHELCNHFDCFVGIVVTCAGYAQGFRSLKTHCVSLFVHYDWNIIDCDIRQTNIQTCKQVIIFWSTVMILYTKVYPLSERNGNPHPSFVSVCSHIFQVLLPRICYVCICDFAGFFMTNLFISDQCMATIPRSSSFWKSTSTILV